MEKGLLVRTKPTGPEGKPPMSAEAVRCCLTNAEADVAAGLYNRGTGELLLAALRTAQWAIEALKATYLAARDGLDDDDDSADMCHWIGADLKALGVDVERL